MESSGPPSSNLPSSQRLSGQPTWSTHSNDTVFLGCWSRGDVRALRLKEGERLKQVEGLERASGACGGRIEAPVQSPGRLGLWRHRASIPRPYLVDRCGNGRLFGVTLSRAVQNPEDPQPAPPACPSLLPHYTQRSRSWPPCSKGSPSFVTFGLQEEKCVPREVKMSCFKKEVQRLQRWVSS